jgi:hypothetical protein
MHYANGRAAKVGDIVRGKGYNVKHEIIGVLVSAKPAETSCNCSVAHVGQSSQPVAEGWFNAGTSETVFPYYIDEHEQKVIVPSYFKSSTEYGQLDAFVALDPTTGEVLPPVQQE